MTAGQSTQPGAVSCDDPSQSLHLFPRETRSVVVGKRRHVAVTLRNGRPHPRSTRQFCGIADSGVRNRRLVLMRFDGKLARRGKKTFQVCARKGHRAVSNRYGTSILDD